MDDNLRKLKKHFLSTEDEDCEDTFLIQVRTKLQWEKDLFLVLVTEMQNCCEEYESKDLIEKWVAEGFWYIPQFVRDWTNHPNFPKQYSKEYYEKAFSLLDDLAFYFFMGSDPKTGKPNLVEAFIEETK